LDNTLTVKLVNELMEVERLGDIISEWSNSLNLEPASIFDISIVFDEIIANIINHGFLDNREHYIDVNICIDNNTFISTIEDDGIEFNPLDFEKDDRALMLNERESGGRGINIIKKYMDVVDYRRRDNKNILTINRKIKLKG